MASAKKPTKKKKVKPPQYAHEEVLELIPEVEASDSHARKVRDLGNRIIMLIEKSKYHPTVALDTLQLLLTEGIGILLGQEHRAIWEAHVHQYHEESRLLSIMELFTELKTQVPKEPPGE